MMRLVLPALLFVTLGLGPVTTEAGSAAVRIADK